MAISLFSNKELTVQGSGGISDGLTLESIRSKIAAEVGSGEKIKTVTLNFSGTAYNNAIKGWGSLNEYYYISLTNSDSDASNSSKCTNLHTSKKYTIGGKETVTLASTSIDITKYFNDSASSVQGTNYSRLSVAFTSESTYKKTYTFSLSVEVTTQTRTYTVTFKNYDGTVLETKTVAHGSTPTPPSNPTRPDTAQYDYEFSGWDKTVGAITSNTTYTAQYTATLRKYGGRFSCIPVFDNKITDQNGSVISDGDYHDWDYGTVVKFTAVPGEIYRFINWSDGNTDNPRTITINENLYSFNANFDYKLYTVTVKSNNDSYGTVSGGGTYEYGNVAILTATPSEGYRFTGRWLVEYADGSSSSYYTDENTISVPITRSATYTAIFAREYSVTFSEKSDWENKGTITGATEGTYEEGTKLTFTAVPNSGYKFAKWKLIADGVQTFPQANPITVTVNSSIYIAPVFNESSPEFLSAQLLYSDRQVSQNNKVKAGEGFRIIIDVQ